MKTWTLGFRLAPGSGDVPLRLFFSDTVVLRVSRDDLLRVELHTRWEGTTEKFGSDPCFTFTLTSPKREGQVTVCYLGYSFRLYVDGYLEDEDWPLGEPVDADWQTEASASVTCLTWSETVPSNDESEELYAKPFQNFVLPGHNTGVGDCMPFARDGRWCLYYLLDRRGHASKQGLGAHQWAQISTADLKNWTIHPMAVGITEQWEGSICTGSLIQKDGKTYAFYAVRMSDGSPARLTWAVSDDGVHFEKSGRYFALTAPYEPVSARDPMVFSGADGQYHMLVTTSLVDTGPYGGCLAHLTSPDLLTWTQHGPFIVPGYSDQPECSDYFEWNGWYYLVFSNFAIGRYRMSRNPFGPWIRPENDVLDATAVRVPKTAAFRDRRLSAGFLSRRPMTYAGNAVTHELFQRSDGTLGIRHLEEILPEAGSVRELPELRLDAGQNRAASQLPAMHGGFRLKAMLRPDAGNMLFGIILKFGEDRRYRIEFDPAAKMVAIVRPGEDFDRCYGRDLLRNVELSGGIPVDLIVNDDILDMTLADGRVMTMRLDDKAGDGTQTELYAMAGSMTVSKIRQYAL